MTTTTLLLNRPLPWASATIPTPTFPWTTEVRPSYVKFDNYYKLVPEAQHVIIAGTDNVLGTVGGQWANFTPDDLLTFAKVLTTNFGWTQLAIGDLRDHKQIFVVLAVDVDWYLIVHTSFDGNGSIRADFLPVHLTTHSTHQFKLKPLSNERRSDTRFFWSARHVGEVKERIEAGKDVFRAFNRYQNGFAAMKLQFRDHFTADNFQSFAEYLLPTQANVGLRTGVRNHAMQETLITNFTFLPAIDGYRYTKWGALCAVCEWSEWTRVWRSDKRTPDNERRMLNVLWDGDQMKFRQKAFDWLAK